MGEQDGLDARETYNVITDTVVGLNVRKKDNLYQAAFVGACLLPGLVIGATMADNLVVGLLLGGLAGLTIGIFASGIFLMIYRAIRHASGQHD